jgi:hypothetical protein
MTFPFTRGGYCHVLLRRHEQWCLVERTWIEDGKPHLPHYEVVRLQQTPAKQIRGRMVPAHESYPRPSQWGREAWSEPSPLHALRRAERVCPEAGWHLDPALQSLPTTWHPFEARERHP